MVFVENCGERPEVVTIGHNPYYEAAIVRSHVAIPSDGRPKFLDEFIYHKYWENRTVISSPRALLHGVLEAHQLVGDQGGDSNGIVSPGRGAGHVNAPIGIHQSLDLSRSFHHHERYGSVDLSVITNEMDKSTFGHRNNLGEQSAYQENLDIRTEEVFRKIMPTQRFLESRFSSLERYVSFMVMFHAMTKQTLAGLCRVVAISYHMY